MRPRLGNCSGWCAAFAFAGICAAGLAARPESSVVVLVGGDTQGYLAPCGCTFPMTGGILRMATAVATYRGRSGIFLENGGLVQENPPHGLVGRRQNRFKVETIADALRAMQVDAVNIGEEEAEEGSGALSEIADLTDRAALSTSLEPSPTNRLRPWVARGPLLIGGVTPAAEHLAAVVGANPVSADRAISRLVQEAAKQGLTPVLLYRGVQADAEAIARQEPALGLIVFRSSGNAPSAPERIGRTLLVTPGDRARNLIRLSFSADSFGDYRLVTLTPDYVDDPAVSTIYRDGYLTRVARARLIEQLPRVATAAFSGANACRQCHGAAFAIWRSSAHAHALLDLERQRHDRDPDCLGCHVTGLSSARGFKSRPLTPNLANVTCESCHGPAKAHALSPRAVRLPKIGAATCLSCHSPDNSPNFHFNTFWPRIRHR